MSTRPKITVAGEVPKELLDALARIPEEYRPEIVPYFPPAAAAPTPAEVGIPTLPEKNKITVAGEVPAELIEALTHVPEEFRPIIVSVSGTIIPHKAIVTIPITELAKAEVIPSLPWYVSWLQPVLDYIGILTQSVVNWFTPIFKPIGDGVQAIKDFIDNPTKGLVDNATTLSNTLMAESVKQALKATQDALGHSSPEKTAIEGAISAANAAQIALGDAARQAALVGKNILAPSDAAAELNRLAALIAGGFSAGLTGGTALELLSLGQVEGLTTTVIEIADMYGHKDLVRQSANIPWEWLFYRAANHFYASKFTPEIPNSTDLIDMRLKGIIDDTVFNGFMGQNGFNAEWSRRLHDARFNLPSYAQVLNAYYRGVFKTEELEVYRDRLALDPRYKSIFDALTEVIPDYSELTNELVKEVIDLPTYTKYLQWHGFNAEWAKRIWDAHFFAPSLGDVLTAWRRGIINEADVDRLMIIIDLDPRFKNVFDTRKYADPSLMITRMMYETGAIGADAVPDLVHRQGYAPEHEKAVTNYVLTFQERLWRRRYLVSLSTAASLGAASMDTVKSEVVAAGYSEGVAEWMIKAAEMRTKIASYRFEHPKPKLMSIGNLKDAYLLDKIDADKLRTELLQRGYLLDEVDLLISLMDEDKVVAKEGRQVIALSITQLLDAYRYEQITRDVLFIKLQTRGLALDEVETLVKTKEKQWGVGGA
jgi:hypothetical protein